MEMDEALRFAVILGWDDVKKDSDRSSARVEYPRAVGAAVDSLSIWLVNAKGQQHRVCDRESHRWRLGRSTICTECAEANRTSGPRRSFLELLA
jgi:hypothetical protein